MPEHHTPPNSTESDFREVAGMLGTAVAALLPFLPETFPWEHEGQVHVRVTRAQWEAAREATEPIRADLEPTS